MRSKKSDVLSVFTTYDFLLTGPSAAIATELSPLVQTHDLTNCRTFFDLALALYSRISKIAAGCTRIDVIADRYFKNGLKEETQGACGNGGTTFGDINDYDEIPSNFQKDFIRNSFSKNTLYQYLAKRFIDLHSSTTQIVVVTYKDAVLKTQDISDEDIN